MYCMKFSSHVNSFRITGSLWAEPIGHVGLSSQRESNVDLCISLEAIFNKLLKILPSCQTTSLPYAITVCFTGLKGQVIGSRDRHRNLRGGRCSLWWHLVWFRYKHKLGDNVWFLFRCLTNGYVIWILISYWWGRNDLEMLQWNSFIPNLYTKLSMHNMGDSSLTLVSHCVSWRP